MAKDGEDVYEGGDHEGGKKHNPLKAS